MAGIAVFFGSIVGFALGLTGGGGGIFAVPLLVYGLSVAPREAVGVSLASVGGTALFGVIPRLRRKEVDLRTGLLFAAAGMLGAPLGTYSSTLIPGSVLLVMFAALMCLVAWNMWRKVHLTNPPMPNSEVTSCRRNTCHRDENGQLKLTSSCAMLLFTLGLTAGFLSGLFGVGGGFVIVPVLVLFSGMKIHHAVATSLMVIVLISISGVSSFIASGDTLDWKTALPFLGGGLAGMWAGGLMAQRLQGPTLQKIFATGIVLVALFILSRSAFGPAS